MLRIADDSGSRMGRQAKYPAAHHGPRPAPRRRG
ncbi:RNA polymerase sigma factor, partial [Burkholderia cepacia]